jgi:hypothetical protein
MMRDNDLTNTYLCSFTVPANAPARKYHMRFITTTDWEIIRVNLRVNEPNGLALNLDDVNLRYRPTANLVGLNDCVAPNFSDETPAPPETELVANEPVGDAFNATRTDCTALDWFNTDNWNGYLPTSEVQFVFDPFPFDGIFDANGDGVADTLYDALSYNVGVVRERPVQILIREAVIAMLNDRYDSNHPEAWWAVEIDTAEALANGDNAMLELAQQYALSNASCG